MAIPEKIKNLANKVRTAVYGVEVRESIAQSMEDTANTADEAKQVSQQLIDGSFDEGLLNTQIEQRLGNLETEYTPRLSAAEQKIVENHEETTAQLAQNEQEINDLNLSVNYLSDNKADKAALAQVASIKRDKDVEIGMADLSQEVKEGMTGGSVAVVGEDAVGNINLKDKAVSNEKLSDIYTNVFPWLTGNSFDLDNIHKTGTYMLDGGVLNNPTGTIGILEVVTAKTYRTDRLTWLIQRVTRILSTSQHVTYQRTMQITKTDGVTSVNFKDKWKIIGGSSTDYNGMKWVALGTSITQLGEYTSHVAGVLGLNLDNRGVGGGGVTIHATNGNTTMQAVASIEDFNGIVSIEVLPNDWWDCPLGVKGDKEDSTWYGAIDKICKTITQRTSARPFFIASTTTAYAIGEHFDDSKRRDPYQTNSHGKDFFDYVDALKEIARLYSIPVVDVCGESGLGGYHQNNKTLVDHIHLSALGGQIMGNHIVEFLKYKFIPFPSDYTKPTTA